MAIIGALGNMATNASWLLLLLALFSSSAKTWERASSTVQESRPEYRYPQTARSLRTIDFKNFEFRIIGDNAQPVAIASLQNGLYQSPWKMETGSDWVRLDSVDIMGSNSEHAVISLAWVTTGASASDFQVVQVFSIRDNHPVLVQQILFNTRGCKTAGTKYSTQGQTLTVKAVHGWEHCCPKTLDVLTYVWNGSTFSRHASKSIPLKGNC